MNKLCVCVSVREGWGKAGEGVIAHVPAGRGQSQIRTHVSSMSHHLPLVFI